MVKEKIKSKLKVFSLPFVILCIITVVAIGVCVWSLFFRKAKPTVQPQCAPQQIEQNAVPLKSEDSVVKMEQQNGGGAVSLTYSNQVYLSLATKEANLMFQNPLKSNQEVKLDVVINGKTIVESGTLGPGYKVEKLTNVDVERLTPGEYSGKFVVSFYNTDSDERAILNTEIPITIHVCK